MGRQEETPGKPLRHYMGVPVNTDLLAYIEKRRKSKGFTKARYIRELIRADMAGKVQW